MEGDTKEHFRDRIKGSTASVRPEEKGIHCKSSGENESAQGLKVCEGVKAEGGVVRWERIGTTKKNELKRKNPK